MNLTTIGAILTKLWNLWKRGFTCTSVHIVVLVRDEVVDDLSHNEKKIWEVIVPLVGVATENRRPPRLLKHAAHLQPCQAKFADFWATEAQDVRMHSLWIAAGNFAGGPHSGQRICHSQPARLKMMSGTERSFLAIEETGLKSMFFYFQSKLDGWNTYIIVEITESPNRQQALQVHPTVNEQLHKIHSVLHEGCEHCVVQIQFLQMKRDVLKLVNLFFCPKSPFGDAIEKLKRTTCQEALFSLVKISCLAMSHLFQASARFNCVCTSNLFAAQNTINFGTCVSRFVNSDTICQHSEKGTFE